MTERALFIDGLFNARDLGGLKTFAGRRVRTRTIFRSDSPDRLTTEGWKQLHSMGVRTVIDLTNDGELPTSLAERPADIQTVRIALDGGKDPDFWAKWGGVNFCTPVYYGPHLKRFPELSAAVLEAVANAAPGGILIHCASGRDRTGLITLLLLTIAGVGIETIAEDHALSYANASRRHQELGTNDDAVAISDFLSENKTSTQNLLKKVYSEVNFRTFLDKGGLAEEDIEKIRARLVE